MTPDRLIEHVLDKTSSQWRWLRFLRHSAMLATLVASVVLLLGIGATKGWLTSPLLMSIGFILLALAAMFAWTLMGLIVLLGPEDRTHLAAALERSDNSLKDRLNTLVYLEQQRDPRLEAYAERINKQTHDLLSRQPPPFPFFITRTLTRLAVFAIVPALTIVFYAHFHPWQQVMAAARNQEVEPEQKPALREIPPTTERAAQLAEDTSPWGEIRISQPGCNLRANPLDIVPLRIEAAANRPFKTIEWFTSIDGQESSRHALPPPGDLGDSSHMVHDTELDLQAIAVQKWDVVSYFARATTVEGQVYESEVYFVELLPPREELDAVPGGTEGPASRLLEQLTEMIRRQQEVIRQTHRRQNRTDPPASDQLDHGQRLAREEQDLSRTVRHVAAGANRRLTPEKPDKSEDPWQRAESTLADAASALEDRDWSKATSHEQAALAELITIRKHVQQRLHDDPRAFETPDEQWAANDQKQAAQANHERQRLDESSRLEEALNQQVEQYRKIGQQPDQFTSKQLQDTTHQTKELLRQLKTVADQHQQQKDESSQLRKELSERNSQQLEQQCDRLSQSQQVGARKQSAGALQQGLDKLAKALTADNTRRRMQQNSDRLSRQLERMRESRRQQQSARQFVKQSLRAERDIERAANPKKRTVFPALAAKQQQLNREMDKFVQENKQCFSSSQAECSNSRSAMRQAAKSLGSKQSNARQQAGKAANELKKLDESLEALERRSRLADAHELRRMLDQQISQLKQCQKQGAGQGQCQSLARQSAAITDQLKTLAENDAATGDFGPQLREALNDQNKQQLDQKSQQLARASNAEEQRKAMSKLQQGLRQLALAFDASAPRMLAEQPNNGALKAAGQEAIARGMQSLQSAARRQAGKRPLSPQGRQQLGRDALANLEAGINDLYGYNQRTQQTLRQLQRKLKNNKAPLDLALIRNLLQQIQQLGREVVHDDVKLTDDGEIRSIDASRLPPDYRASIEEYFRRLSEQ